MKLRRVRLGEWLAGVSGVVLLVSLFLDWHGEDGSGASGNAWESFSVLDVALAILALSAIAVVIVTATQRTPAIPIAMVSVLAVAVFVAAIWLTTNVIWPEGDRLGGLWLGFASCLGVLGGCLWAMRDESPGFGMPPPWKAGGRDPGVPITTLPPPEPR